MDDKDREEEVKEEKEEAEESDSENLRDLILQQLANLEQSDVSDDDSYKVRLSCILEDDESESSGAAQKDYPKDVEKGSERTKESEKGPPERWESLLGARLSESLYDSELSDEFLTENVQITDLDDVTLCEKTEETEKEKTEENASEDDNEKGEGFAIKKLKSSDNVHRRPFVVRRRELSSDSSDLDISVTNSGDGPSSDLKIVEIKEGEDDENTLNAAPDNVYVESETSLEEDGDQKTKKAEETDRRTRRVDEDVYERVEGVGERTLPKDGQKGGEFDVLDNEILSSIFAKVSRTYLEKTKGYVKWEENEKIDRVLGESPEDRSKGRELQPGDHLSFQDVHIRGTLSKEYNPPVPPETYLWEELKRLRERGGYPWTYLDKPPFDEATWKKYMEHVYEPINPPPLSTERKVEPIQTSFERKQEPLPLASPKKQESLPVASAKKPESLPLASDKKQEPPSILTEAEQEPLPSTSERVIEPHSDGDTGKAQPKGSSIPETEKQITRIPSESELAKKAKDLKEESKTSEDMEVERISAARDLQERLEDKFLSPTPTATTATTASQSRTDITSSVLDTSGFEDSPEKHGNVGKTRREQIREQAQEFQQRLRNHAGRIRHKFSNMPKPALNRRDRLKKERKSPEKSKFKLPEMHAPKISLPDRSKFKFPEKAKFHLPESSKFHLPERPKFHLSQKGNFHLPERPKLNIVERAKSLRLPERGKFHLPDKSKFHLPERARLHMPERAKLHMPERAKFRLPDKSKFHLPDKSKFHLPDRSKFHLPERAKFHLPERAKFNLPSRPKLELPNFAKSAKESITSPRSLKSRFDFDLKSYPKLFTKHASDYATSSPKQTRGRTPPPKMKQPETPAESSEKWRQKIDELKYADDELDEGEMRESDSRKSESLFDYNEREMGYVEDFGKMPHEMRTLSTKSSASRLSDKELQHAESYEERKKVVLEEINSDEFFLRQKGISQDNIDVGKYLSHEIREAFRSPDVNALAKMDYMDVDDENIDPRKYQAEPTRPKRLGSTKKKSILKKTSTSDPSLADEGYKTYPPRRPGRKSRSQSKSLLNEEALIAESGAQYETDVNISRYDNDDVNLSRYENVEDEEDNVSEYYKSPGPAKEYQHYKVPRSHPVSPGPSIKRRSSEGEDASNKRVHEEGWGEEEFREGEPPKPMARRKSKKKLTEELESTGEEQIPEQSIKEPKDVVLPSESIESPVPPKRTRSRSSGSRSLRSLATEDDVNRSFRSEPGKDRLEQIESEIIVEQSQPLEESHFAKSSPELVEPRTHEYEITDLDDAGFGYATVGKPTVPKPERPPPPRRKKEISLPIYNTYPRRTPVRPSRNYSTLGPSRPPRKKKIPSVEQSLNERQFRTYSEIKSPQFEEPLDVIEVSGSSKDLQTEKVIEKMKGRPLPPPPRPPRQKSKGPEEEFEPTEEEQLSLSILKDDEFPLERKVTAFVHEPPVEREFVEEICASTQTDPLPEDFTFEGEDSGMIQEFSHEQLRIQQAFLEEMKREEEEMRQRGKINENDMIDAELKAEVIRQIEDIIAEEKKMLEERKNEERLRRDESGQGGQNDVEPKKPEKSNLDVEADMGYASLERRGHRQEPQTPSTREIPPELPPKMDKLQVKELDVEMLNVQEVQAGQIFVKELQSNRVASQDIDNTGGNMALGNMEIPSNLIEQIVAKIPWDSLREVREQNAIQQPPEAQPIYTSPARPQRRQRVPQQEDSDKEESVQPRRSHRRHRRPQNSSDEDESRRERRQIVRSSETGNIPELSVQLVRACTSASVQALRSFVASNATIAQTLDREMCVQAVLCIAVALIAGFFLFGYDAKIIHLHHWDFQFPPQPPNAGF